MLVYCGQTVGRIKMELGMQVGLGPGHMVLDGDPQSPQIFAPFLLWPNGCMDQDGTWHGGRPHPRGLCVRWGLSPHYQKRGRSHSPQFSAHFYCGQTAGWIKMALRMEVGLGPGYIVLDGDPAPLPQKEGRAPNFRPIFIATKRLDASRCHLLWT